MSTDHDTTTPDERHSMQIRVTAFSGGRRIAAGPLSEVEPALATRIRTGEALLVFDDATGRVVDSDLREPAARGSDSPPPMERRGRGRPKLGVVAREVTLLPRHWEWLNAQPGGASVVLRRLVDEARRASAGAEEVRRSREAGYRVAHALAGDLPGYEEAMRALFAGERRRFAEHTAGWPADVRGYVMSIAFGASDG